MAVGDEVSNSEAASGRWECESSLEVQFPLTATVRWNFEDNRITYSPNLQQVLGRPQDWLPSGYGLIELVEGARTNRLGDQQVKDFLEAPTPFICMDENGYIKLVYLMPADPPHRETERWLELNAWVTEKNQDFVGIEAQVQITTAPDRPHLDELTGLPKQGYIMRLAAEALPHANPQRVVGLFRLDLDYLRTINNFGHPAGNKALKSVAHRLLMVAERWGAQVHVGRVGGDEFAAVASGLTRSQIELLANDFLVNTDFVLEVDDNENEPVSLPITVSIGMAISEGEVTEVEDLEKRADLAQQWAKDHKQVKGRSRLCMYSDELATKSRRYLRSMVEVRAALEDQEITPRYELLVDSGLRTVGVEALSRMHLEHGLIALPQKFLQELAGSIVEHDLEIMRLAMLDVRRIQDETDRQMVLHCNVTPFVIGTPEFASQVEALLLASGLEATQLVLEIIELDGLPDLESCGETVCRLQKLGVGLALDDYPVGCSSTLRLVDLPYFRTVKFAAEVLKYIEFESLPEPHLERRRLAALQVLRAEVDKFHCLGMKVLVEHVDNLELVRFLQEIGVDYMQGYWFGGRLPDDHDDDNYQPFKAMTASRVIRSILSEDSEDRLALADIAASA